jgi:hypothetical protein
VKHGAGPGRAPGEPLLVVGGWTGWWLRAGALKIDGVTSHPPARTNLVALLGGVAAGVALAAGGAVGAGVVVYDRLKRDDQPEEMWAELGNALGALMAGALVAIVLYVLAAVVVVRSTVQYGRQRATGVVVLLAPAAVGFGAASAAAHGHTAGLPGLVLPVQLAVVVAVAAVIGCVAGAVAPRSAVAIAAATGIGMLALSSLASWRGEHVADQRRAARYEETGAPLALIDGTEHCGTHDGAATCVHVARRADEAEIRGRRAAAGVTG